MTDESFARRGHHPRRAVDGEPVQREGRLGPHRRRQVLDEARAELLVRLGQVGVEGLVLFVISAVNSWNSCQGSRVDT